MKTTLRLSFANLQLSVLVLALFATTAPSAPGQCFGPDNLDIGNCCQPTQATLPPFNDTVMPGLGICWDTCQVATTSQLRVEFPTPLQTVCGQYTTTLVVTDGGTGIPLLVGPMVLDYTRTWTEVDTNGNSHQVWRFVAKADLGPGPVGVNPTCPTPSCLAPVGQHQSAFYYGYVDYVDCPLAGMAQENALVLYHACDRFIHTPGLSDRPGVFHPDQSYAIVAPHSNAQPFIPAANPAPGGPLLGEATRNVNNFTFACTVEDRVVTGALDKLGAGCLCTMQKNPKQQTLRKFTGTTACVNAAGVPGTWTSLNIAFPTLPWLHMVTTSIGCWSNPDFYPGTECAWVDEGLFIHQDACTGEFVELKYGGTTADGWLAVMSGGLPVQSFTDIADNFTVPLFGPYVTPIMGSIRPTDHLIYVNTP